MANVGEFIVGTIIAGAGIFVATLPIPGAQYVGYALFSYGTGRIISSLRGEPREMIARRIDNLKFNVRSTQATLPVVYGRARIGIRVSDIRLVDSQDTATPDANPGALFSGADNNDVLAKVGAFCLGSEDGSGIQTIDQIRVYDDGVNAVGTPAAFSSAPSATGVITKYDDHLLYILEDGDDAQAQRTELADHLGWGATMVGRGVAYGAFFFKYDREVWDKGVPQISARVTGNRVYDPRTSTWIGWAASGASSDNPALCILDYLTSQRYGGAVPYAARDGGSLDFIDEQSFIDAANYCDDLVTVPSGTEKRFRMNAVLPGGRVVGANIVEMLSCCRGELVWQNGTYRLIIRQVTTAETYELTEDEIVGKIEWVRKGSSVPNKIEAAFPNDGDGDFVADSVTWPLVTDTTFLDEDNGVEHKIEIALPFTTTYHQALRTVMVMLREMRNDVLISLTAHQSAYTLQVGDVVNVTHQGPGWVQQPFMVRQVALTPDGLVRLALQQYTAGAYTLDTLAAEPSTPTFNLPDPLREFNTVEFIYERPQSSGIISTVQNWRRELSYAVGQGVRSVEIAVNSYLLQPTLDSGTATPTIVPAYTYHVDVSPNTTVVDFLKTASPAAAIANFSAVDEVLNLDNTNNGVAVQVTGAGTELNRVTFEVQRVGAPTGTMVARLYDDSGGLPGTLLATSQPVAASDAITASNGLITFGFPTPGVTLTSGTVYHLALEYSDGTATDYVAVGVNNVGTGGDLGVLNGAWATDTARDGVVYAVYITGDGQFNVRYDENNILIGGAGAVVFTITPYDTPGGLPGAGSRGRGDPTASITTKTILDYDDIGARLFEIGNRRVDFFGEQFGNPGPGAGVLSMDNTANGFAFDFTPAANMDLSQVGVYLRRVGTPTGNVVCRVYDDSAGLPGTQVGADSATIGAGGLGTTFGTNPPNSNFTWATPIALTGGTLYHIAIEYSAGTATDYVDLASESTGACDELNGAWAAGPTQTIDARVYAQERLERVARSALPNTNVTAAFNFSTGDLEIDAQVTGGANELDDLTDVNITTALEGQVLYRNATEWVNASRLTIRDDGAAATPAYSFLNDPDTGMYLAAAGNLGFSVGGTVRLNLTATTATFSEDLRAPDGAVGAPAYGFTSDPDTGVYLAAAGQLGFAAAGTVRLAVITDRVEINGIPLRGSDGTAGAPGYSFVSDTNTGIFRPAADSIALTVNGVERVRLDTADFTSTVPFRGPTGSAGAPAFSFIFDTNLGMYRIGADILGFAAGGVEHMRIDNIDANEGRVQFDNAQVYVSENPTESGTTPDWDLSNVQWITNNGARTMNVNAGVMQPGGCYILKVRDVTGAASQWTTWTGVTHWMNNQVPQFPQVVNDVTVVIFYEIENDVIGAWFQAQ